MKTKRSEGLAVNNKINKVANMAKNNFVLKLFYFFLPFVGIQFAYADIKSCFFNEAKLSFEFIYGDTSIESMVFDHTTDPYYDAAEYYNEGTFSISTTNPKQTPYKITVDTCITHTGSTTIAGLFNESLGYTPSNNYTVHMVQLAGAYNSHASNLDFRVRAELFINDELVSSKFYLAHNNKNHSSPPSWWIGSLDGTKQSVLSRAAMTVHTKSGKFYCLNQNGTDYKVVVTSGSCKK